jgi:hypothetical protein
MNVPVSGPAAPNPTAQVWTELTAERPASRHPSDRAAGRPARYSHAPLLRINP